MKTNRNIWRIVTLALAMIMLFSVVACQNGGNTTQTTEGAGNGTTLAPTTEKPTTEKPATQKPTTEKPTTPAPTTTPEPTEAPKVSVDMESTFGGTYTFSNYLPGIFATKEAILLAGADHLESDLGVSSLAVADIYHYYIDLNEKKREDGSVIEHADKSLTWKFTVPEDGIYEFCFQMRMKDGAQRGNVVQIDDGDKISMDFQFKDGAEANVRDEVLNSYMTGFSAELTAGEHTIKMTYAQECPKTFHFRNIYVAKREEPTALTFTEENFANVMPDAFKAEGVIALAASDAQGLGIAKVTSSGIDHFYLQTDAKLIANITKPDGSPTTKSDYYMSWTFDVAVEGDYDVLFNLRLKNNAEREIYVQLDDAVGDDVYRINYKISDIAPLKDDVENTYVSGLYLHLTEGKHTLYIRIADDTAATWHFRNVYLVKQEPIMVDAFTKDDFSSTLPAAFAGANAIYIDPSQVDANSTFENISGTNHRLTTTDVGLPSANCAVKLQISGVYHYYLEPAHWGNPGLYSIYLRWGFEVPEDGTYAVCFYLRLKNQDKRFTQLQIDDAPVSEHFALTYDIAKSELAGVTDSTVGTYLTGFTLDLTAGEHTLTARMPDYTVNLKAETDNSCPSFHFRGIYLIRIS
ncbi:MAG: hypothetical protein IJX28_00400 [Clostridia bacterium]|nr:hypothetical protein [Clostridia bacterium]